MFDRFEEILKVNESLLDVQKKQAIFFILFVLSLKFLLDLPSGFTVSKDDLKVDINKATFIELQKVPYIGEKTALKIIELRENYGYIENINQLKSIRNFKKFKYYIKVK